MLWHYYTPGNLASQAFSLLAEKKSLRYAYRMTTSTTRPRRPPGRPPGRKFTERKQVHMTPADADLLAALAASRQIDASETIRQAIREKAAREGVRA